jgi:hypothetical protein
MYVGRKAKQVGAPLRRGNAEWFDPGSLRFMGRDLERVRFTKNVREMKKEKNFFHGSNDGTT